MPKLKCVVNECCYHYHNCCTKNYIDVDGNAAHKKEDTCCNSFQYVNPEDLNYEIANFDLDKEINTEVYCDVTNCVFEKNQKCYADKIEIKSHKLQKEANHSSSITNCTTFEPIEH